MTYIVAFDDSDLQPWVKFFEARSYNDVQNKIIKYIIDMYDLDDTSSSYDDFVEACRENNIFIGKIKESEEFD